MSAEDLARWEPRWRARDASIGQPEPFLVEALADEAPAAVLDAACGDGRNALWLARRGFRVTALDIAPAAIARLRAAADAEGLPIATRVADLDDPAALDGLGTFPLLVAMRFHPSPAQWDRLLAALAPGGRLLLCSFRPAQHAAHGFPLAYCLDRARLEEALQPRLRLLSWQERDEGRDFLAGSVWVRPA